MTRRHRVKVGVLLSVALAALALATCYGQSVMSVAMSVVCVLALGWAYVLVNERRKS